MLAQLYQTEGEGEGEGGVEVEGEGGGYFSKVYFLRFYLYLIGSSGNLVAPLVLILSTV